VWEFNKSWLLSLHISHFFQATPGVKTRTLQRPLANDGSFYTVPVCRRIDDFHFSRGTVSKSKFTSCLIKFTKFEVSFKVLVRKEIAPSNFSSCYFCFSFWSYCSSVRFWCDETDKNQQTSQITFSSNFSLSQSTQILFLSRFSMKVKL